MKNKVHIKHPKVPVPVVSLLGNILTCIKEIKLSKNKTWKSIAHVEFQEWMWPIIDSV